MSGPACDELPMVDVPELPEDDREVARLLAGMDDPRAWLALPGAEIERLVETAALLHGATGDPHLVEVLAVLYGGLCEKRTLDQRTALYRRVCEALMRGGVGVHALLPWLFEEPEPALVSTAALDYAVVHPPEGGDPLTGPRRVLAIFEKATPCCAAGLFLGLLLLGDRRVLELLRPARRLLLPREVDVVAQGFSGFLFAGTVEFFVDWLEELQAAGEEDRFGSVAGGLAGMPAAMLHPLILDGQRVMPARPDGPALEDPRQLEVAELAE